MDNTKRGGCFMQDESYAVNSWNQLKYCFCDYKTQHKEMYLMYTYEISASFFIPSEFHTRMESRSTPMPSRRPPPRSTSNDSPGFEKTDGSQSDSAVSSSITEGRSKRRPSLSHKLGSFMGIGRRSSSANHLGTLLNLLPQLWLFTLYCFCLPIEGYWSEICYLNFG